MSPVGIPVNGEVHAMGAMLKSMLPVACNGLPSKVVSANKTSEDVPEGESEPCARFLLEERKPNGPGQ